jgi:hypothetical protein
MPLPAFMTQKAYAAHKRVSPQYINKLVRQGKIVLVRRKVNVRQANAAIAAHRRPGRVVKSANARKEVRSKRSRSRAEKGNAAKLPSATQNLTANRARYEAARAQTAELELARLTRNLLPAAEVLEAERRKNANLRARFRRLARSLAPLLHRATSPAEVEQALLGEIDLVLAELARDPLGIQGEQVIAMPVPQPETQLPVASSQLPVQEMAVAL